MELTGAPLRLSVARTQTGKLSRMGNGLIYLNMSEIDVGIEEKLI